MRNLQLSGEFLQITEQAPQYGALRVSSVFPGLDYSRGLITDTLVIQKFGQNDDIDAGGYEDIWLRGGIWVHPTAARVHNVTSSSASDDNVTGQGAKTIQVYGLDANYNLASELVSLDGTVAAPTTNSYQIIHRAVVRTAGTFQTAQGTILLTAETDDTVTAQINPGDNQTLMAIYQVPANYTAYMTRYYASINNPIVATSADVRLVVKPFDQVYQVKHIVGILSTGGNFVDYEYSLPIAITEKSMVKLQVVTSGNNVNATGGFDMIMVPNV